MCQIFGFNSARSLVPDYLLRGFFCRGGGTGDHKDGWGIAWYNEGDHFVQVQQTSAWNCCNAERLLSQPLRTGNLLAHVRKATVGAVELANTHPFSRELWGYPWIFAHNGDLKDFAPEIAAGFQPRGDTDSEAAFGYLLTRLQQRFGDQAPTLPELTDALSVIATDIAEHGTFNFILLVGDLLFAHGTTDLYWASQRGTPGRVRLIDRDEWVDTQQWHQADDELVVIATQPVTDGHDWQKFGKNELRVFAGGQVLEPTRDAQQLRGFDLKREETARLLSLAG